MGYSHISMLLTLISMASVVRATLHSYKVTCLRVLVTLDCDNGLTCCNSTRRKPRYCGVRRIVKRTYNSLIIDLDTVLPVRSVRDLGFHVDSGMLMPTHITGTASSCQIRSISQSVGWSVSQSVNRSYSHSLC